LTLEITESVLLAAGDHVQRQLESLKTLGVMLALDDFGTGYASLAYLQRFPVDILKIDRTFTAQIAPTTEPVLLKGIIELGSALGLTLIAEGIETVRAASDRAAARLATARKASISATRNASR